MGLEPVKDKMKNDSFNILFITQEDPFYVRLFFEEFFRKYPSIKDIKAVVIAPTMGKKSFGNLIKQMYNFYGPVDFVRMGIRYTLNKVLDKSISSLCRRYNIPVMNCNNINSEDFLKEIEKLDLDLIASVAASQIFKERLIKLPKKGCINIHNSRLPKYRGMMPNFWQMLNEEKSVGTTIHRINIGIDDGDILLQKETPILNRESLDSIIKRTKRFGAGLMIEAINGLKTDSLKPLPNPKEEATYFSFPTKKDVQEFRRKGYKLI